MPKCPKCKKKIDCLDHYQSGENKYHFFLNEEGNESYEGVEFQGNSQVNDYECPECKETLFTDEEKAVKFLKGK